jgi:hypothetical protein
MLSILVFRPPPSRGQKISRTQPRAHGLSSERGEPSQAWPTRQRGKQHPHTIFSCSTHTASVVKPHRANATDGQILILPFPQPKSTLHRDCCAHFHPLFCACSKRGNTPGVDSACAHQPPNPLGTPSAGFTRAAFFLPLSVEDSRRFLLAIPSSRAAHIVWRGRVLTATCVDKVLGLMPRLVFILPQHSYVPSPEASLRTPTARTGSDIIPSRLNFTFVDGNSTWMH